MCRSARPVTGAGGRPRPGRWRRRARRPRPAEARRLAWRDRELPRPPEDWAALADPGGRPEADPDTHLPGLRAHLAGCQACREEHESLRALLTDGPG
jgi:hypothetical protein